MGYESKLIIGEGANLYRDSPQCLMVEATFDLGKLTWELPWGEFFHGFKAPVDPKWFFYGTDGDTQIIADPYGDHLTELPIEGTVVALEQCHSPRAKACAWIRAWTGPPLTVVHYGH